jgi:hypothetical protein
MKRPRAAAWLVVGLLVGGVAALPSGCRRDRGAAADAGSSTVQRGAVKLVVTVQPKTVRVGDQVRVELRLEMPSAYSVVWPDVKDFGELPVRMLETSEPQPGATGFVWRRTFALAPEEAGEVEIPALSVKCAAPSTTTMPTGSVPVVVSSQPVQELTSEAVKVQVASTLDPNDTPAQPRDITETLLPPRPPMPWWQKVAIAGGIVAVLAGAYAGYRGVRARLLRPPPPVPPEVWALRELRQLGTEDWVGRGRVREFYYRVTEIVRSYIERKFGLAAPEMTTEEFLTMLTRSAGVLPYDALRLRVFMESCDMVKYAALTPRREDAEQTLGTARAFVDATAAASARAQERVATG